MKKLFLIILTAFLLVGCQALDESSFVSSDDLGVEGNTNMIEESAVINNGNARKVCEYKICSNPAASNPTVEFYSSSTSTSFDHTELVVKNGVTDTCIAKVTLNKIARETREVEKDGYYEKFYYTDVELIIDEIYVASETCSFKAKERVLGYTQDKWNFMADGTWLVEYIYREFPLSEEGNCYIAKLIRSDDGENVYVQPLSFPFLETGKYTDTILEFKGTASFDEVQWSFSDEVLKRYGIIE